MTAAGRPADRRLSWPPGIRQETVSRIESGKHTPSVPTVDRLDRALRAAGVGSSKTRPAGCWYPQRLPDALPAARLHGARGIPSGGNNHVS